MVPGSLEKAMGHVNGSGDVRNAVADSERRDQEAQGSGPTRVETLSKAGNSPRTVFGG